MITTTAAIQSHQMLRQASLVLISVLLAKSGLTTDDIGIYETLLFIGTTLSYFWLNALIQSTLTFIPSVKDSEKHQAVFNIFLIFNALSLALFLILFLFKYPISLFFAGKANLPFYTTYAVFLLLNFPPLLLESLWTIEKHPLSILAYSVVSNIVLPFAIVLPLWLGCPFVYSFYGMISVAAVRYIWLIIKVLSSTKNACFSKSLIHSFLVLALPLMAYSFLNGFVTSFTSWIVHWFHNGDQQAFAIFRYGAREFPLALALATGLSNSIIPVLTTNANEGLSVLKKKSERLWHILFPTSIILMLTSKSLFPLVFNPSFSQSAPVFCVFLLLLTSRALFPQAILLALKETKMMLYISIIETLSIIILSFLLIKPFDTEGVAWALVLGFLLEKILIIVFLKRQYQIDFRDYTNVKLYLIYSILLVISYFMQIMTAF
jgi:O-antigen/teichoic acid export membrane protein